MIKDHVKCLNCDTESFVDLGEEICPECNIEGSLVWVNPKIPEVEV
jgi:uncharacterized protein (UPF0212 family)